MVVTTIAIGLGTGFALSAAVGAHRATTAFDRLRDATLAPHAIVNLADPDALEPSARVATLEGVAAAARMSYVPVAPAGLKAAVDAGAFGGLDDSFLTDVYRPLAIKRRLPQPGRADEVTVNEALARRGDIEPGDEIELRGGSFQALDRSLGRVRVVGVHRGTFDVGANARNPSMLLPAAFVRAHLDALQLEGGASLLRLHGGERAVPQVAARVRAILGDDAFVIPGSQEAEFTRHGLRVQAIGFAALAAISLVAVAAAGGQALRRHLDADRDDLDVLKALAAVASSIWRVGRATQGANAPRRVPAAPALGAGLRPLVGGGERRAAAAARAAVVGAVAWGSSAPPSCSPTCSQSCPRAVPCA